ncbi:MAG TPA: 5-bromo-4-chloroindolyl phosphate hydrolysis family protein [Candidatus Thiothrix moscowensis]|uniref:5-bromo-4-chloroindolyl phosphate hydrolysis family protein n=1 Tax=unclassified Thiothrix TaxID=2636184 RepID=UPI0025F6738B|nr:MULTISPECIES: 5-bromo-4-chloroindolyl phosphate hydrolysis family protein [unclassified Thiothrix]HRJ53274.1 5-bromo-4-chloroindolyl phosphate hydrolysis family protein [Candidatus Thiothrix moscowensis]HRJ93156.1 5-bromo-4-chloroindolyl phosphate hydrolysis family protein [Candidatus Thiothrix moscowensis]
MSAAKRYEPTLHNVRYGIKGILLYLLPLPVLITAIGSLMRGAVMDTLVTGGVFAALMLGASIARHGFRLQGEYERRKIARAPSTPFKTVAAIIISLAIGVLDWWNSSFAMGSILPSTLVGAVTFLGFALYYGLDPRRDKATGISIGVTIDEVLDALDAANVKIDAIEQARRKINNPEFNARLQRITSKAREVLTSIEDDPTRLSRARKFLKVYLDGTQRVTEGYARAHQDNKPVALETNFSRVLDSIEQTFAEQHTKLLEDNHFDLDVQIEVLETQLKREGVL